MAFLLKDLGSKASWNAGTMSYGDPATMGNTRAQNIADETNEFNLLKDKEKDQRERKFAEALKARFGSMKTPEEIAAEAKRLAAQAKLDEAKGVLSKAQADDKAMQAAFQSKQTSSSSQLQDMLMKSRGMKQGDSKPLPAADKGFETGIPAGVISNKPAAEVEGEVSPYTRAAYDKVNDAGYRSQNADALREGIKEQKAKINALMQEPSTPQTLESIKDAEGMIKRYTEALAMPANKDADMDVDSAMRADIPDSNEASSNLAAPPASPIPQGKAPQGFRGRNTGMGPDSFAGPTPEQEAYYAKIQEDNALVPPARADLSGQQGAVDQAQKDYATQDSEYQAAKANNPYAIYGEAADYDPAKAFDQYTDIKAKEATQRQQRDDALIGSKVAEGYDIVNRAGQAFTKMVPALRKVAAGTATAEDLDVVKDQTSVYNQAELEIAPIKAAVIAAAGKDSQIKELALPPLWKLLDQQDIRVSERQKASLGLDIAKTQLATARVQGRLAETEERMAPTKAAAASADLESKRLTVEEKKQGTETQNTNASFAQLMEEADRYLSSTPPSALDVIRSKVTSVTDQIVPGAISAGGYGVAVRAFINSQLRKESGAAIGASEFSNAASQYIPAIGDSPETLAAKAKQRQILIRAMKGAAGKALSSQKAAGSAAKIEAMRKNEKKSLSKKEQDLAREYGL